MGYYKKVFEEAGFQKKVAEKIIKSKKEGAYQKRKPKK